MINWYCETWWQVMARPIYFYTKLREEGWKHKALTFFLWNSWLLAAVATLAIFVIQYIPIGATLVEGISGIKFIIILPVLVTLALVFMLITLFILAGVFIFAFGSAFYAIGFILHYTYQLLGGKGSMNRMIQSSLYSTAVMAAIVFPLFFAVLTRYDLLDLALYRVGFNLVYVLTIVFVYGLWAVAGRKAYDVPKWKAFTGALVPVIFLLIFGLLFDKIALPKLESWIAPLK